MSTVRANTYLDASGGSAAQLYGVASPPNGMGFRNRIINGDMRIDQRNAGASVTPANGAYTLDRWWHQLSQASKISVQRSTTAPTGFTNSALITSLSAYSVGVNDFFNIIQIIEGFNAADLGWGTANAQTVTVSFWVRSSLTGTFGGSILNNSQARAYPFTYAVSAANTWEQKSVTVPGDTSGTWPTDNSGCLRLSFGLGAGTNYSATAGSWQSGVYLSATGATSVVGTNGATFYITGVQIEAGTVASPFERRDYGRELMMCQRYCWAFGNSDNSVFGAGYETSALGRTVAALPVVMRASPTLSASSAASTFVLVDSGSAGRAGTAIALAFASPTSVSVDLTASGTVANAACILRTASASANIVFSSEL